MRALSFGFYGNSSIDIIASNSLSWCDGVWFKPHAETKGKPITPEEVEEKYKIEYDKYDCLLVWHQGLSQAEKHIINKFKTIKPYGLVIGNQHGYNKSMYEMVYWYSTPPPEADFWNFWGQYNLDKYEERFNIQRTANALGG